MPKTEPTAFTRHVIRLIHSIPKGKVASYGLIAKLAGKPHGSRGVSWILHSSTKTHGLPWFRVINSQGRISMPEGSRGHARQRSLLESEGVVFVDGRVDFKKFLWARKPRK